EHRGARLDRFAAVQNDHHQDDDRDEVPDLHRAYPAFRVSAICRSDRSATSKATNMFDRHMLRKVALSILSAVTSVRARTEAVRRTPLMSAMAPTKWPRPMLATSREPTSRTTCTSPDSTR